MFNDFHIKMYDLGWLDLYFGCLDLYFLYLGCLDLYFGLWTRILLSGLIFWVSGLIFWVSGLIFWVSELILWVSGRADGRAGGRVGWVKHLGGKSIFGICILKTLNIVYIIECWLFGILTKKTRAEKWRRLLRKMSRDLSYETDSGPKTKTDISANFISLGRKSSQCLKRFLIYMCTQTLHGPYTDVMWTLYDVRHTLEDVTRTL